MDTKLFTLVVGGSGFIASTFFALTALGLWIDKHFNSAPFGVCAGMLLAFFCVILSIYTFYKKINAKK